MDGEEDRRQTLWVMIELAVDLKATPDFAHLVMQMLRTATVTPCAILSVRRCLN